MTAGFLRAYLRERRGVILTFGLFAGVFALAFALYRLPLAAALYPGALCAALGAGILALDAARIYRIHRELEGLRGRSADPDAPLPGASGVLEGDYRQLVLEARDELRAASDAALGKHRDTVDYYTAWVHQIKTPITSMRLTLEREDTRAGRKLRADLGQIERYVGMVLAYLRLDSVSTDYVFRERDLDGVISSVLPEFASEFIDRRLRLDYTPVHMTVVTDEKWLGFVIGQLLSNALKYTREGSVSIYAEGRRLVIRDTGIGIDPADLPRVFEKGYTGLNGRRDGKASGLGLYLVREICGRLGIGVSLTSATGEGTRATLDLEQYELTAE